MRPTSGSWSVTSLASATRRASRSHEAWLKTLGDALDPSYMDYVAEKFVIVHRSYDPILIEHLGEMLREAGLVARVIGTRDVAIIGVGPSINTLQLSVPQPQAAEATEFLEAFFAEEGDELLAQAGLLDDEDDEDDEDDASESQVTLSPALAGVAVLFCGLGHVYARRRITGAVLAGAFIVTAFGGLRSLDVAAGAGFTLLVLVMADLIGGQFAVRVWNRNKHKNENERPSGVFTQLAVSALYVGLAIAAAHLSKLNHNHGDSQGLGHGFEQREGAIEDRTHPYANERLMPMELPLLLGTP